MTQINKIVFAIGLIIGGNPNNIEKEFILQKLKEKFETEDFYDIKMASELLDGLLSADLK